MTAGKSTDKKRVLIPVATGLALRNVMRTGLPGALAARGLRPIYAVPETVRDALAADAPDCAADLDVLPHAPLRRWDVVLRDLAMDVVTRNHRIATMETKRRYLASRRDRTPWKVRISPLFGKSKLVHDSLNRVREALFTAPEMEELLRKWEPAVVFSNNVFDRSESAVLRRAGALGVPTVGMVHSWDNPTNKGVLPAACDVLLVWSAVMRDEMTTYFGVPAERTIPVGSPQFDIYAQALSTSRADLLREYDLHPDCRIVMYGTSAPGHSAHEPGYAAEIAAVVARLNREGRGPVALVVRLHPRDHIERYAAIAGAEFVRIEVAGRANAGITDRWNPTDEDHQHFAALMRYADVVGNQFSTIALDAACNDRPTFHVRYDPDPVADFLESVERLFSYTHTQRLLDCGASYVATSPAEIADVVVRALSSPDELRTQRATLAAQEGYDGRGLSAERIAAILASVADGRWEGTPPNDDVLCEERAVRARPPTTDVGRAC